MIIRLLENALPLLFMVSCATGEKQTEGGYYAGDFHQHTTYSGDEFYSNPVFVKKN